MPVGHRRYADQAMCGKHANLWELRANLWESHAKLWEFRFDVDRKKQEKAGAVASLPGRVRRCVSYSVSHGCDLEIEMQLLTATPLNPSVDADAPRLVRPAQLLAAWQLEAAAAVEARVHGRPRGPITGFPALDDALGGAMTTGVHVLHGTPGAGKTSFSLQIAAQTRCPTLLLSTEMPPLDLLRRVVARTTSTFLGRLRSGELQVEDAVALAQRAVDAVPQLVFADATQGFASPDWLRHAAEATRGEARFLLVIVDSVHSWLDAAPGGIAEYERLGAGLDELHNLALRLDAAILGVAERNRATMQGGGLSASAGHRKFEYLAESVWDLSRESSATPNAAGEVAVSLTLAKNRAGIAGRKVGFMFHGAIQRFREVGP